MELAKTGDIYIPGSPDYMIKSENKKITDPATTKILAYLVPVIAVQHGNPRNINFSHRPGSTRNKSRNRQSRDSLCGTLFGGNIGIQPILAEVMKNILT